MQSRMHSLIETVMNIGTGYFLGVITQIVVFPYYNLEVNVVNNMQIAFIFTAVSIIRSYFFRRIFNKFTG